MAQSKKNTKKSSQESKSKASSKKVDAKTNKTSASKKKNEPIQSKVNHDSKKKHDTTKSKDSHDKKKQHVSQKEVQPNNNVWMMVAMILGILIILLVIALGVMYFDQNNKTNDNNNDVPTNNESNVQLLIIEDPECINCEVDLFVSQVKENLIPNLEIEKLDYESQLGEAILSDINAKQVPVYLFSTNFDQRDDWTELKEAFVEVNTNEETYYMLNPQLIPNKVLTQEPIITDSAIVIGDENAPVTLIKFTDFECPYCAIAEGNKELVEQFSAEAPNYVPALPKIESEYIDTGKVKMVFYNMPANSLSAHLAGLCANEQGAFIEYSQLLWDKKDNWDTKIDEERIKLYKQFAQEVNLDTDKFDECFDSEKYIQQIEEEKALGQAYGITGTPAFVVGTTLISGAQDYSVFKQIIDAELAK
ncbi:MAG: DsbA family protein [Nanoarchaeota archaeon]